MLLADLLSIENSQLHSDEIICLELSEWEMYPLQNYLIP